MAEIDGGALSFKSVLDNDQLNAAIDETLRRVQGFSDAVVGSGDVMDKTTQEMVECIEIQRRVIQDLENSYNDLTAKINAIEPGDAQNQLIEQANSVKQELDAERQGLVDLMNEFSNLQGATSGAAMSLEQIRAALGQIGDSCAEQEQEIDRLETQYKQLSTQMSDAFMSGRDNEYRAINDRMNALKGEIAVRKQMLNELRDQSNALENEAQKIEKVAAEAEKSAQSHLSFRTRLREVREELMQMELAGDTSSAKYKELQARMGELSEAMDAVTTQQNMLKRGERMWDGLLSGLSGVSGAFSAAQGAVALFSGENENLQKIMLKVQSLMAVTIGLKEVQLALDKDEAFQLVTINGLKEWWNNLLAVGRGEQAASTAATVADTAATVADTAATTANTAAERANTAAQTGNTAATGANATAQGLQTTTAIAGTTANIGLAGAFRMVGAAIKSIPVFGWIAAALSALIAVISHFVGKAREGKKAAEEFYKSIAENAYKPIASVEELSLKWNALGDDLDAKTKFIEQNKAAFDALGVSIVGVTDAENLLVANKQNFINAQIEKAKAMILVQQAQEKIKKLVEDEQTYNAMPDTTSQWVQTSNFGTGYYVEVDNKEKRRLGEDIENQKEGIRKIFTDAATAQSKGWDLLKEAGIDAANTYEDGTVGAIEQAIQSEQMALKHISDPEKYQEKLKEIEKLQKQVDAITGNKMTAGNDSTGKDPFIEKLNKYKAEYQRFQKWVNSGDEVLVRSANQEFAGLLAEGATYIDYLKNQRDQILAVDVASRTKEQNQQLRQLNDSIAEETRATVLEAFNNELNAQLSNARTVLDMLNVIEQKRKELSGDGTELDNAKAESLDEAESGVQEQARQETEALLSEYASYVEQKRRLEQQFNDDVALMMRERENASTDEQRTEIDNAIQNRTAQYNKDVKSIGGIDYDAMLAEYGTFEEKKQAIIDEYDAKRKAAQAMGNEEMVKALDEAQARAISSLASDELTNSDIWGKLFGNLDGMAVSEIETLVNQIEENFDNLAVSLDPADLAEIRNQLNNVKDTIIKDNPFAQLGKAIKAVFKSASTDSEDASDDIKDNWVKLGKSTEDCFAFVADAINQCEPLKEVIGDVGSTALSSLTSVTMAAIGVATAVKTAEKSSVILAIIQAALVAVQAIYSLFMLKDKQIDKQIEKHQAAVDDLANVYTQLSWEIDRALGGDYYRLQQKSIENLEQQKREIQEMQRLEEEKKKTDDSKVKDYIEQQKDIDRQIQDTYDEIAEDILQTTGKDFADELGNALVDAFSKGEDAAEAFEETVNDVLKNAIVNQLKRNFLEQQLQDALDGLYDDMGYWSGDDFIFNGLTDSEIADFKRKVQTAADNYNQALEIYKDLFEDLEIDDSEDSLTGAVKGVSEETANILAGQMNAIRINQMESTQVLRQSLQALNTIANNTAYMRLLQDILSVVRNMQKPTGDSLRSQGLS